MTDNCIPIVLASTSPRRQELIQNLNIPFSQIKPDHDEIIAEGESYNDYIVRNSKSKAVSGFEQLKESDRIYLGSDTVVLIDNLLLEKPKDNKHAYEMLSKLSGKTHTVRTGVHMFHPKSKHAVTYTEDTKVTLIDLDENEINTYIKSGEPFDKAGAYAAQGKGSFMVSHLEGSYTNVVGLPLASVYLGYREICKKAGRS